MKRGLLLLIFCFSAYTSKAQLIASASGTSAICAGTCTGSATVLASGGTPSYTYLWSDPAGQITPNATYLCTGTYTVTVTDNSGSTATATVFVPEPSPLVIAPIPDTTICIGQSATLTANATGGTGPYTYLWTPSGAGSTSSVTVSPTSTTTYTVGVTDAYGCSSAPLTVTVMVNPPLSVFASADITICTGNSTTLSAVAAGGNGGPYIYAWTPSGASGSSVSVSPTTTTTYTVTSNDGCSPAVNETITVTVDPCAGIQSYEEMNSSVLIFPNPFTSQTTIDLNADCKFGELKIINTLGKEIRSIRFSGKQINLEREKLNAGVYYIQIIAEDKIIGSKKITVQ